MLTKKTKYVNARSPIIIICRKHGEFKQIPNYHQQGAGCTKCQYEQQAKKRSRTTQQFTKEAKKIHGNKYVYKKVQYVNKRTLIVIICKKHGEFKQTPDSHLCGKHGCPDCNHENLSKKMTTTTTEFIHKAKKIHGDKYIYKKTKYHHSQQNVCIICKKHGEFLQLPTNHLQDKGCPTCANYHVSKIEKKWLHSIGIPCDKKHRQVTLIIDGKTYITDGYDPKTKTVYEFYGDYFHGNPKVYKKSDYNKICHKTFGELYKRTIKRGNKIKKQGYKLITIWEKDFRKQMDMPAKN